MDNFWIPLLPFVVFLAWLLFFGRGARKACPDCNKPLSLFQSPFTKTKRQWFEGGYVCPNCGCETDIRGKKVLAGTGPQWRSVITYLGVLTLAVGLAVVLNIVLLTWRKSVEFDEAPRSQTSHNDVSTRAVAGAESIRASVKTFS